MAVKDDGSDGSDTIWQEATKDVRKLDAKAGLAPQKPVRRLRIRIAEPTLPAPPESHKKGGGTDRRTEEKLRKGEMKIDGRIDLHGWRLPEARAQLQQFILQSVASQKRCVLVITGKGTGEGSGVIRREFRHWLDDAKIRPYILSVAQAVARHGGDGAWYIYLRRLRA